jgi:hypothetical protein
MLNQIIAQISQTNPELMGIIQNNQEAFLNMMNQGPGGGGGAATAAAESVAGAGGQAPAAQPHRAVIMLTPQDREGLFI